ncbi:MAG: DUF2461 domain-containing protein [Barnesiella sp.]|nr:DUF2461 domain-containing protein [Barnesiella sp.]MDE5829196.1 DUF2461 domain-containing protein [Duncaniella sp.]
MAQYYMPRLFAFLRKLGRHNDREWFHAHKAEYDDLRAAWIADLDRLISCMSAYEPDMAAQSGKDVTYRIYRDTRFSQDKTPFKLHFAALLSPYGKRTCMAADYLHVGVNGSMTENGCYGGLWMPESDVLKKVRKAIVDNIEEFEEIIHDPRLVAVAGTELIGDSLKTVPKGWERDHPYAHLIRMKEYGKFAPMTEKDFSTPSWVERAAEIFQIFKPFNDFINYSITEEL